jgi:hypothetical protein
MLPDGGVLVVGKNGKLWGLDSSKRVTLRGHISLDYKIWRPSNVQPTCLFPVDLKINTKLKQLVPGTAEEKQSKNYQKSKRIVASEVA